MSTTGRIAALKRRHAVLDEQIAEEMKSAAPDTLKITELKKEKLQVKEEMTSLEETEAA
ncbi:MAG: YdcH family protein [Roseibium sp.]|uniref:YdcH family protein n=1 Tax=Roseibium sp. TaxID=1936156 RepID=UPI0032997416